MLKSGVLGIGIGLLIVGIFGDMIRPMPTMDSIRWILAATACFILATFLLFVEGEENEK